MSELPGDPQFVATKEYRRFQEFLEACRRYRYIGLCYGAPGVGKTLSARHYARAARVEPYLDEFADAGIPPPDLADCHAVVYTPEVATTPRRAAEGVRILGNGLSWVVDAARHPDAPYDYGRLRPDPLELLIVDEADRLKLPALEQLRDTYDRGHLGLVLIGMPELEKRLARYAQLYSRVGFVHQYRALGAEELRFILERQWARLGLAFSPDDFTDTEALATIARITGGNFRLVQRLFAQIERVLEINRLRTVTKEVVEAARESLVIGPLG